jgi:acyl carrier protein
MSTTIAADEALARRICEAIARALEVPPETVPQTATQGSPEKWDSLGHLSVVMELETEFGVSFTMDEAIGMRSVPDAVRILKGRVHGG